MLEGVHFTRLRVSGARWVFIVLAAIAGVGADAATLEMTPTVTSDSGAVLSITVTDDTPYDFWGANDCDGDFGHGDPGRCSGVGPSCDSDLDCGPGEHCVGADDTDCNDNGIPDVVVKVETIGGPPRELCFADLDTASGTYRGTIPVSTRQDLPGVLFIRANGVIAPVAGATYFDDGGTIGGAATTFDLAQGDVVVRGHRLVDNGDNDGFADTNETVDMYLTVVNRSGIDLHDVVVRVFERSDLVDCVVDGVNGTTVLADGQTLELPDPFRFRVAAGAERPALHGAFGVRFEVTVQSDEIDLTRIPQLVELELDLNASAGGAPAGYVESFESAVRTDFVTFTSQTLDVGRQTVILSNGFRCQYNDPDASSSNAPGATDCFLGFTVTANNGYDWHIHDGTEADNNVARAYVGTRSLHWGVHPIAGAKRDTTRFSQLDAIRSLNPVNLPFAVSPEMSFKHQISLLDNRITSTPIGQAADRGVVAIQLADDVSAAVGDWIKIYPYENRYDAQGTDNFSNCTFDPVDDGDNEDSFFDPMDPYRRLGPSSTCMPEFAFVYAGDTDYLNAPADLSRLGRDTVDGPGLRGSVDRGVWVEPRFDLSRFRGQRIRLRFLATTIQVQNVVTADQGGFAGDDEPGDDGWYIDDLRIPQALATPVTLSLDTAANAGLPACGTNCSVVAAALSGAPDRVPLGGVTTLSAAAATADVCIDGPLQYQYWIDVDADGNVGVAPDVLVRDWSDNPDLDVAVPQGAHYGVRVRCASAPACQDAETFQVLAGIPGEVTSLLVDEAGGNVTVTYTPSCDASDNTLVFGPLEDVGTYGYTGQVCDLGNTGQAGPFDLGAGSYFFLVVPTTGAPDDFEGSYGTASGGTERPAYASPPSCSFTQDLSVRCD